MFSLSPVAMPATLSVYRRQNSFCCSKIIFSSTHTHIYKGKQRGRGRGSEAGRHNQFSLETVRASIKVKSQMGQPQKS